MSAIKQLKQPGKLAYQEDCTKGIGMQPYDKYDWQSGSGYKGSVFAVASRRCSSPAIQVNTYRDEKQQHLVHSEWISFVPDQSGSTAEVSFRIPDYKIKDLPLIWIDYNTRCNAFTQ